MKVIGVIPARYASTRFEGKVIAELNGKPMIQHVYERTKNSQLLDDVVIACDDERVKSKAEEFGAKAVMTKPSHPSGTDRIVEAIEGLECDIVVNVQGDEPLIDALAIDQLVEALKADSSIPMATLIKKSDSDLELDDPNVVKVVIDENQFAIYFSRSKIPYNRDNSRCTYYKHLGIYAYSKDFLVKYAQMEKSSLETAESLEQLRVLEAGYKIKTVVTDLESIGVDTREDLINAEKRLKEMGL